MTRAEIMEYAAHKGNQAAADILLLVGPDGFDGTYDEYLALERELKEEVRA